MSATMLICLLAFTAEPMPEAAKEDDPPPRPAFSEIQKAVEAHFAADKAHFAKRLLTRGDAAKALKVAADTGWEVPNPRAISDRFLADGDSLVRELRARSNRSFAQRVAGYPNVYDRLDQLRRMPYGMRRIREFATTKDGDRMLAYMTTTKGGAELSKQLSRGKNGKGFGKPTGRLYTAEDLVAALHDVYKAEEVAEP